MSKDWGYVAGEPEFVLAVVQDHGPGDGGWGPATIHGANPWPTPMLTTRASERNVEWFREIAEELAKITGKPTKVVRFRRDEELFSA